MIKHPISGQRCDEMVCGKKIKFSGCKTSTLYLSNPRQLQVERIEVDGCAIVQGKRCDWMARTFGKNAEEIFIELKKRRMNEAIEQLEESIKRLSSNIQKSKKRCFIVQTCHDLIQTQRQKFVAQFKSRFNADLKFPKDGATVPLVP
jgi:hypothetical protein